MGWIKSHRLIIIIAVVLCGLAATLWYVRTKPADDVELDEIRDQEGRYVFQPRKGDICPRLMPNLRNERTVLPAIPHPVPQIPAHHRIKRYRFSTNSELFRGSREFMRRKLGDTFRILVFGTGVTFGNGVDDEFVYPLILEELLNSQGQERTYEVFNLGLPGSTTERGVALLRHITVSMDFDYIIFCYGVNDGLPSFRKTAGDYGRALQELVDFGRTNDQRLLYVIEPRSTFYPQYFAGHHAQFEKIIMGDPDRQVLDLPAILDEVEKERGLRLERDGVHQKIVRYQNGEPTVLSEVLFPYQHTGQAISMEVYRYLDTHEVDQACYIDGVHLNEDGHRIVAQALFEFLESRGVLQQQHSGAGSESE